MKILELFSGTHSVGKVAKEKGWEVLSLDLKDADINVDVLEWDYRAYPEGHFDVIWSSPPCTSFSVLQCSNKTNAERIRCIEEQGLPILRRTEEIIAYFKPKYWFIENPQTGFMKNYIEIKKDYYTVDYCMYSDWGYRKRTAIWTNITGFLPKVCDKKCGNIIEIKGRKIHKVVNGNKESRNLLVDNNIKMPYNPTQKKMYRIPPLLIDALFNCCL